MEKTYDPTTTCKASWVINKILWWDMTIHNCWYYYRFRLNDWTRDYVIRWLEKNNVWYGSWCENIPYSFSGWNVPKVWEQIYVLAQYSDAWIIEQWKESYDKNINLPSCSITADWDPSYDAYLWADKCKVSWILENIQRTFTDTCWFNLKIEVKNWNNTYFVWWREYFTWNGISACLWTWEWRFQVDSTSWKITTKINSWDPFYAILNQKDNSILRYGENEYNADTTIPVCAPDSHPESQSMTWWITEEKMKLVMDGVEKEVLKLGSFNNNINKNTSSWKINTISSWTSTYTQENASQPVSPNNTSIKKFNTTKQVVTTNKEITNTSSNIIVDSWATNNSTQVSTWINEAVNTWTIIQNENVNNSETWSVQDTRKNDTWNINIYSISWIILLALIILYFIFKKSK